MPPPARSAVRAAAPVDAWLAAVGASTDAVATLVDGLRAMDVRVHPEADSRSDDRPTNGIVAFTAPSPAVLDFVECASRGRGERILALSLSAELGGDDRWELLHAGACDVFTWVDHPDLVRHVGLRLRRWHAVDELLAQRHVQDFLVGESRVWQGVLREAVELARFTRASVLITGESGTGKERVAQLIHDLDPRPHKKDFVVLDCSTVVPSLSGSEFFGHEKGAFTGAATARAGAFELADGGTLFLDEVGELPVGLQAELLRVIQEGTFKRVGSNVWRKSAFRLVCATNRDVQAERAAGRFRTDFFYRIAECTLRLPSLRERTDDIVPLFRHFFGQLHPDDDPPRLEEAVHHLLVARDYPGNVRDLRSLALRISHRYLGDRYVTVGDIPEEDRPVPWRADAPWRDDHLEDWVRRALASGTRPEEITSAVAEVVARLVVARETDEVPTEHESTIAGREP